MCEAAQQAWLLYYSSLYNKIKTVFSEVKLCPLNHINLPLELDRVQKKAHFCFNHVVTLKIRSRSSKSNHVF